MDEVLDEVERSNAMNILVIGILIGTWGLVSGIAAAFSVDSNVGESDEFEVIFNLAITYASSMAIFPAFILIGAYASSGLASNKMDALGFALGCTTISYFTATMFGFITLMITMSVYGIELNDLELIQTFSIQSFLIALSSCIIGAFIRIFSTNDDDDEEIYDPSDSSIGGHFQNINHHMATLTPKVNEIDVRINAIESLISSDRFNKLIYGNK